MAVRKRKHATSSRSLDGRHWRASAAQGGRSKCIEGNGGKAGGVSPIGGGLNDFEGSEAFRC